MFYNPCELLQARQIKQQKMEEEDIGHVAQEAQAKDVMEVIPEQEDKENEEEKRDEGEEQEEQEEQEEEEEKEDEEEQARNKDKKKEKTKRVEVTLGKASASKKTAPPASSQKDKAKKSEKALVAVSNSKEKKKSGEKKVRKIFTSEDDLIPLAALKRIVGKAARSSRMVDPNTSLKVSRKFLKQLQKIVQKEVVAVCHISKRFVDYKKTVGIDEGAMRACFDVVNVLHGTRTLTDVPMIGSNEIDVIKEKITEERKQAKLKALEKAKEKGLLTQQPAGAAVAKAKASKKTTA